jgi:transcriptional regulator with XRE-family HTH domain
MPTRLHMHRREQTTLQELLRDMRVSAGLRQSDVATKLGVPQSFVSKYEAGERRLDVIEIRRLCELFGSSLSRFSVLLEKKLNEDDRK